MVKQIGDISETEFVEMIDQYKCWYLLDKNTLDITGPFDLAESCRLSVTNEDLTGHLQLQDSYLGAVRISTVFMGMDTNWGMTEQIPELFETRVFGGKYDGTLRRYHHFDQALEGHLNLMQKVEDDIAEAGLVITI